MLSHTSTFSPGYALICRLVGHFTGQRYPLMRLPNFVKICLKCKQPLITNEHKQAEKHIVTCCKIHQAFTDIKIRPGIVTPLT